MAKPFRCFVRCLTALIGWMVAAAPLPEALGQLADEGIRPIVQSSIALAAADDTYTNQGTSGDDARLTIVEKELQKLIDANEKRKADAARKPTFQMGGQLQVDYLFIGQNSANRASV